MYWGTRRRGTNTTGSVEIRIAGLVRHKHKRKTHSVGLVNGKLPVAAWVVACGRMNSVQKRCFNASLAVVVLVEVVRLVVSINLRIHVQEFTRSIMVLTRIRF